MTEHALAILLRAIALVETGGDPAAIGAHGERGAFQMTPAVVASAGGYSERHAAAELRRIERALAQLGIDPQPYNVALAYNAGLGAVGRGRAPMRSYDYALRVTNTFNALANNSGAAARVVTGVTPGIHGVNAAAPVAVPGRD